jgi:broad specificity phosphatase PhoE
MTTRLLLARHGATRANLARPYILEGLRPDSELAGVGFAQARAAGEALRTFPVGTIYSSPLRRARATAGVIAERLGVQVEIEPGLAEADVGLWAGLSWQEVERRWPGECAAFRDDPEQNGYLGGENLPQVRARVVPVVEGLVQRHAGECFLVVAHGAVNRVLLAHWLGIPLRFARRLPQDNAAFNVVEFTDGEFTVRTLNQATHLTHLLCEAA